MPNLTICNWTNPLCVEQSNFSTCFKRTEGLQNQKGNVTDLKKQLLRWEC